MQQCGHQLHPHGPRDDCRQAGHQGGFTTLLENHYHYFVLMGLLYKAILEVASMDSKSC